MTARARQVSDFERKIGHALPSDYRNFLLAGPYPEWTGECEPENPSTCILFSLWDLGRSDWTDLSSNWDARDERLPDWFLEIAEIYDGVKLGIGLHGMHEGRVYSFSWDDGNAKEFASSFREFLDRLHADGASFDSQPANE